MLNQSVSNLRIKKARHHQPALIPCSSEPNTFRGRHLSFRRTHTMMKILVIALIFLQHAPDFGAAQCAAGWSDEGGQCMKCSKTISGATNTNIINAQGFCTSNHGNLATLANNVQEAFAFTCTVAGVVPYFGYTAIPIQSFYDGTPFVNYGVTPTTANMGDCWLLSAVGTWTEQSATDCAPATAIQTFVCSRPYESCRDLEVSGMMHVAYTHTDTSPQVTGTKWLGTTATYSCDAGYSVSGVTTRTCGSNGVWTDSEPECVAAALCSSLTLSDHSSVSYSTPASGSSYTTGTMAMLACDSDYEIESGSTTRVCQSSGMWTGYTLECEKDDDNDDLAIGLGVGLGAVAAVGLAALVICMCCRRPPMPRPGPPPRPVGYPRPAVNRPYPRRMGPRPIY